MRKRNPSELRFAWTAEGGCPYTGANHFAYVIR